MSARVLVQRRSLWAAWYPERGRRCDFYFERSTRPGDLVRDGWHLTLALGPAYLGLGPGVPTP